ncbi:MAG: chloride channel protein [Myxococcales bacterium]
MTYHLRPVRNPLAVLDPTSSLLQARHVGRLFALCALVGVVAGLGAAGFFSLLELAKRYLLDGVAGYRPAGAAGEALLFPHSTQEFSRWLLFLLPAAGGLVSGLIVFRLAPEAEGHGTDAAIDAYHHKDGQIRSRVPLVKMVASAITIGSGGSAGSEGPISQIGAGFGSALANLLKLSVRDRRILLAAGMGAGIGAIFRTPLAGALFAADVLYREMDIEYEVVAPSILSSVIAYSVFALFFGWDPLFSTPGFAFRDPRELAPYLVLGVVVAIGARVFIRVFYGFRDAFARLKIPKPLKPALGGLLAGTVGLFAPEALVTSYGVVQDAFLGHGTVGMLLLFAGAKVLTTSFTVASGGSGGVFGPAVVLGGAIGGAVGLLLHGWIPDLVSEPGAFAVVGMAGFFASAANTPITAVIMVSEMTGNHQLLVPTMWVCMIAFLLMRDCTLYEKQVQSRADSPTHLREMMRSVLERLRVADALRLRPARPPASVSEATHLHEVLEQFSETTLSCLPVIDAQGKLAGIVTLDTVQQTLGATALDPIVVAKDLAVAPATVERSSTLFAALHQMAEKNRNELLVVDADGKVIDVFTHTDVNAVYERHVLDTVPEGAQPFARSVFQRWFGRVLGAHAHGPKASPEASATRSDGESA